MNSATDERLIGYWTRFENGSPIYLRFEENGLLQWGYQNEWRICNISHQYWVLEGKIGTVCPPNPREEFTPFSIDNDGSLTLSYVNRKTHWKRSEKQTFFESRDVWNPGIPLGRQIDYMAVMKSELHEDFVQRARNLRISPEKISNTRALWALWEYSRAEFASFDLNDFQFILNQGVLIDDEDNMDATLLCHVAEDGLKEAAKLMLDYGADINHIDLTGGTPLDYALWSNQDEMVRFLQERGAVSGKRDKES